MTNLTQRLAPYFLAIGLASCATPKAEVAKNYEPAIATESNPDVRGNVRRLVGLLKHRPPKESQDIWYGTTDRILGREHYFIFDYEGKKLEVVYRDFLPWGISENGDSLEISTSPDEVYFDHGLDGLRENAGDTFANYGGSEDCICRYKGGYLNERNPSSLRWIVRDLAEKRYLSLVADLTRYLESEAATNQSKQNN